jgi:hypothetical protein
LIRIARVRRKIESRASGGLDALREIEAEVEVPAPPEKREDVQRSRRRWSPVTGYESASTAKGERQRACGEASWLHVLAVRIRPAKRLSGSPSSASVAIPSKECADPRSTLQRRRWTVVP